MKQKSDKPRPSTQNLLLPPPRKPRELPPPRDRNADNAGRNKRLPSFISHPNGILLRVFKKQRSRIEKDQRRRASLKKLSGPRFICHPNGIVLKVLNQKPRPRTKSTSLSSAMEMEMETETEMEIAISTSSSSSSMVKMDMETKTKTNRNAKQRVKQRVDRQHYSHAHHWPPQQQYKSKSWTIAIILKLTFVAWDSWTYRIGY